MAAVNDDTLLRPAFTKNGRVQQFDVVLANPPYSIKTWNREAFEHDKYGRCFLGVPPQSRADYAFIQHLLASMGERNGRCAVLLPHGVLNRNEESDIRKNLIQLDNIDAVIGNTKIVCNQMGYVFSNEHLMNSFNPNTCIEIN